MRRKTQSYLSQYENFMSTERIYTVTFYKEYERNGGYWDANDQWVSGPTVRDIVEDQQFSTIESALHFADTVQEKILNEEIERYRKEWGNIPDNDPLYWMTSLNFISHMCDDNVLIYAKIAWDGSNYKMMLSYNIKNDIKWT